MSHSIQTSIVHPKVTLQSAVYMVLLVVVDAVIFVLLTHVSGPLAILFLIAAVVTVPALVLHRREAAAGPDLAPDGESTARGWLHLFGNLGIDLTGVVLAVLIIIAAALLLRYLNRAGFHG